MRGRPGRVFAVFVAVLSVFLTFLGHILIRELYRPRVTYEEGAWYRSTDRAVASLRITNVGRVDAEEIRVRAQFQTAIKDIKTNDRAFHVEEGGLDGKAVLGTISRLVPSETVEMYIATLPPESIPRTPLGFVVSMSFNGGNAEPVSNASGLPIGRLLLVAVIVALSAALFSLEKAFNSPIRTAITRLFSPDRRKQEQTLNDIRSIAIAVESYSIDHDEYPVAKSIQDVVPALEPQYIRKLPMKDGWDRLLIFRSTRTKYLIRSHGRDGLPDAASGGPQRDVNADVVFRDGQFVQWPAWLEER